MVSPDAYPPKPPCAASTTGSKSVTFIMSWMAIITSMASVRCTSCPPEADSSPASTNSLVSPCQSMFSLKTFRFVSSPTSRFEASLQTSAPGDRASHCSSRPKQKLSLPSKARRYVQKTAKSAPTVRWYSSSSVRPEEASMAATFSAAFVQYSRSSGKAAVMSARKSLAVYFGSKMRLAAFSALFQSVFWPFIMPASFPAGWPCTDDPDRSFGLRTRRFSMSSPVTTREASGCIAKSSASLRSETEGLCCMDIRARISRSSATWSSDRQLKCVTTRSSASGPLASIWLLEKVKSVPAGSPSKWHAGASLSTTRTVIWFTMYAVLRPGYDLEMLISCVTLMDEGSKARYFRWNASLSPRRLLSSCSAASDVPWSGLMRIDSALSVDAVSNWPRCHFAFTTSTWSTFSTWACKKTLMIRMVRSSSSFCTSKVQRQRS
mmetsp:Transcript_52141/g.158404  ORF Transcript_52141/g.158404 Transcript_52141/m.158404 type:complete len:435 (-) Transcript_52141:1613-2917(-)